MNEAEMAQFRAMQEQTEKQQAAMMKEMGIDMNEFKQSYDDPELAALDKELKGQGNNDLEDDDALLAQIDGDDKEQEDDGAARQAEQKEAKRQKFIQAQNKEVAMKQQMKSCLQEALKHKNAGDKEQALRALKEKKQIEAALKQLYMNVPELEDGTAAAFIAQGPYKAAVTAAPAKKAAARAQPVAQAEMEDDEEVDENDQITLEDKYHDPDTMVSMAVIEHESKYLEIYKLKFKNQPDEKEFFDSKIESLNFAKSSIETNIQTGITTPDSYLASLKQYLAKVQQQSKDASAKLGANNDHVQRLNKRIKILNGEIQEIGQGLEQQEAEPEQEEEQKYEQDSIAKKGSVASRNDSVISGMEVNLTDKQQQFVAIVKQRASEYHDAVQYTMKELGNKQQAMILIEKAEAINEVLKKLQKGKNMTSQDSELCKSLTPEIVFGMNEIQRLEEFQRAKKMLSDEQGELIAKIKEFSEQKGKAKNKKDLEMINNAINDRMEKAKALKVKIQEVLALSNNKWQPPPIIGEVQDYKTQEKVNEELEPDQIKIKLTSSDRLKGLGASYLDFKMNIAETNQDINARFNIKEEDSQEYVFTINDFAKASRVIGNKEINFDLKKKKFCGTTVMDSQKFKMSGFNTKSVVERAIQLEGQALKVEVTLHKALRGKEFERIQVSKEAIKGYPKPFREADYVAPQPKPAAATTKPAAAPQQQQRQQAQPQQQQKPAQQAAPARAAPQASAATKANVPLPEGMTQADVANPNNLDNLNCMSVLEKKVPEFKAAVDKAIASGTRPSPQLRQMWMDANRKMMGIQSACGNGTMTPEQYVDIQKQQIEKDKVMIAYFQQTGDAKKAAIVQQRLQIIQSELAEM